MTEVWIMSDQFALSIKNPCYTDANKLKNEDDKNTIIENELIKHILP